VDIYDTKGGKIVYKIFFEEEMKIPEIIFHKGRIVYKHKVNGITIFDLKENKTLWKYDTGSDGIYMLGIKVGTYPNEVSRFLIDEDKTTYLIMNTWFGHIYKFDFNTGKVLLEKKRFRGTGNNAGLINSFNLMDMNKDGVKDIVAGSVDNNVYCVNGKDLSVMWEYDTDNEIQLPLSLYDINGDKIPEVFVINDYDNVLFILDGKTGALIKEKNIKDWEELNQTSVILADFNGNGKMDLIVKRNPRKLQLYEMKDIQIPKNSIVWDPKK
jgi:outer membrane protein assembly factor BamB